MNAQVDSVDFQVKQEKSDHDANIKESSKGDGCEFIYMDMKVYNDEDEDEDSCCSSINSTSSISSNSCSSVEIKEEVSDKEEDESLVVGDENLPLNSIKNISIDGQKKTKEDEKAKTKVPTQRSQHLQKENKTGKTKLRWRSDVSDDNDDDDDDSDGPEKHTNGNKRRYSLRSRKKISLREDDFHFFCSESEDDKSLRTVKSSTYARTFKCLNCNESFNHKLTLKSHHLQLENFKCSHCKKCFCNQNLLDAHVLNCKMKSSKKKRRSKNELNCEKCGQLFSDNFRLKKHLLLHDGISYKCAKCKKVFIEKTKLDGHLALNQCKNFNSYFCDFCKQSFVRLNVLQKHISAHLSNPLECPNCLLTFASKDVVDQHYRESECSRSKNIGPHTCEECKRIFPQLGKLKIHLLRHQGISYKCRKCNKSFVSEESLQEHGRTVDCLLTVRRCQRCGKVYRDNYNYQKHLLSHKDDVMKCNNCKKVFIDAEKFSKHIAASDCTKSSHVRKKYRYECDACGADFARLLKLQIHILNVHFGINYQCEKCNLKFPSQEDYDSHVAAKDCKVEEPSVCKVCGKVFAKRDYLKKHQYMHSNMMYKCKFCYCAFMKEKSYKRHIERMNCSKSARTIRLSEFNFKKCRICDYEFESEDYLIHHFKVTHPDTNPHQCFCCESCLLTFKDLEEHIHHHNTQKYTCNLCGKPYTSQEGFRKHRLKHKGAEFKCKFCDSEFLNEGRFKFHVKTCKKNPENGYSPSNDKPKPKRKDDRPRQSRQLHWESRIIMKRLRVDPNSATGETTIPGNPNENSIVTDFFDEPESESLTSERGWFDNYYKTEEDDIAFGLKKENETSNQDYDSDFDVTEFLQSGSIVKKKKRPPSPVAATSQNFNHHSESNSNDHFEDCNDANDNIRNSSSSDSSDTSSEDENFEDVELPIDYNPKKCRICIITFGQEYELLHHFIKIHSGQPAHKCPHCDVECPLFAQLKEHMKTHGIGMGVFNCDNCSKKFRSEKKMRHHNIRCKGMEAEIAVPSSNKKITVQLKLDNEDYCKRCCKKFQTKCGYRRHKQTCKEKRKQLKETKGVESHPSTTGLKGRGEFSQPPVVEKDNDDINLPDSNDLEFDSDIEAPAQQQGSNQSQAPEMETSKTDCSKETTKVKEEIKEKFNVEPPMDSFPCRLCDKKFQYERGIVMHFKSSHPGYKALVCHVCNMHLADKLKEHLKTHGIGEEFICELCGKRFNQKFLSKIHEMWHQGIEYKCNNCKQKFLNKEKMDKHISENRCSNRQSLMRLPCNICGKSYRSKFGLGKHYLTHTPKDLRPVKNRMNCEYCGKWFENNNGLQRHRRIHTGERPFCCRFCPKAFAQEGNCKAHERIHTGESKPRKKKSVVQNIQNFQPTTNLILYNALDASGLATLLP